MRGSESRPTLAGRAGGRAFAAGAGAMVGAAVIASGIAANGAGAVALAAGGAALCCWHAARPSPAVATTIARREARPSKLETDMEDVSCFSVVTSPPRERVQP